MADAGRAVVAAFALLASAGPARAGEAALDREARALVCSGVGAPRLRDAASNPAVARPGAERRARADARRACRAALRALPVPGGRTVGDLIDRDPALARAADEALRRARVAGVPRYFADGGVALEVELPLGGSLGEALGLEVRADAPLPDAAHGG